jgi:condensin complex subunit 3
LSSSLDQEDPRVAATAVVGIAKLILSGMVTDEEVRSFLFSSYRSREIADERPL